MIANRTCAALWLAAVTAVLPACSPAGGSSSASGPGEWSVDVQSVASPAGPGSSAPKLTTSGRGLILSWFEAAGSGTALKFAEWADGRWSAARTAASGDNWFVTAADLPSVMRLADGTLVAEWLVGTAPEREAYDMYLSYSTDDGTTWAKPFTPHHDGTESQHGFGSLFEIPGQGLGLVWLDGRDNEFDPDNPDRAAVMMRFAAFDRNWKQVADEPIDPRVCECCPTSTAVTADGVIAVYRDRSDKEIRDIYVSRFENGRWSQGVPVHADNWEIFACPVNGPSVAARDRQAVAGWFTVKADEGQAYAAFSSDAGRSWGAPVRLDDAGSVGRVDVLLLDDGSAVASWVEFADQQAHFRLRRVDPSGARSAGVTVAQVPGGPTSGQPRIARQGNQLVLAWTESTTPAGSGGAVQRVQTAVAALPAN